MPFQDLPNHIARAAIISDLLGSQTFAEMFSVDITFRPYLLADLFLAALLRYFSLPVVSMIWVSICFLSLPVSLYFYVSARRQPPEVQIIVVLAASYLGTNWFFLTGYFNFCLGVSMAFVALGFLERFLVDSQPSAASTGDGSRESGVRTKLFSYVGFTLSLFCCYLIHFAPFVFLGIIVATILSSRWLLRRLAFHTGLATLLPFLVLGLCRLQEAGSRQDYAQTWVYRPLFNKLTAAGTMFLRFSWTWDCCLSALFLAMIVLLSFRSRVSLSWRRLSAVAQEYLLIGLVLLVTFLALPVAVATLYDIDGRTLPFLAVFVLLSAVASFPGAHSMRPGGPRTAIALAGMLAVGNLVYLYCYLPKHNAFTTQFDEALLRIPEGRTVLPVPTRPDEGRVQTGFHNAALYTALRHGYTPYLFNSRLGEPYRYFHYRQQHYAPSQFWYLRGLDSTVDWKAVDASYDYLIVTKPYDQHRLHLPNGKIFFENDSAAVFVLHSQPMSDSP